MLKSADKLIREFVKDTPPIEDWRKTEEYFRRTRDEKQSVSLPRLRFLEEES